MREITVMQVFRELGIPHPDPEVSWSVGSQVASAFAKFHGHQPPKDNRPKTNAAGTHCFALYPEYWRFAIRATIKATTDQAAKQTDLFGHSD